MINLLGWPFAFIALLAVAMFDAFVLLVIVQLFIELHDAFSKKMRY